MNSHEPLENTSSTFYNKGIIVEYGGPTFTSAHELYADGVLKIFISSL